MTYWIWLLGISLCFVIAERLWPRRPAQRLLRRAVLTDVGYVVLNGHFLGVALAVLARSIEGAFTGALGAARLDLHLGIARGWPWAVQLVVAFVALDLLQWAIHVLLHRVAWLWELHKVHHSIEELDWLGSLRFHFGEVLVYKSLLYVPLALLGFDGSVLFSVAVIGTAIGHYNHSNLRLNLGPMKYLLNGPQMHEWHHVHPDAGPSYRNFAINLALWDWLFGTAYLPVDGSSPARLGFEGMERFPRTIALQELWPLSSLLQRAHG